MKVTPDFAEAAGDFVFGEAGEIADRRQAEALQHVRRFQLGGKAGQRQRRKEARFFSRRDDGRRWRQLGSDARRELARRDADARGQADRFDGGDCGFPQFEL